MCRDEFSFMFGEDSGYGKREPVVADVEKRYLALRYDDDEQCQMLKFVEKGSYGAFEVYVIDLNKLSITEREM